MKLHLTAAVAAAALLALPAQAKMPKEMTWTAYGTNSSGYAQVVAIGNMLKNKYGVSVRPLPGKNDVSRMTPLKVGRAQFCACGIASYFGQEGVFLFAKKNWGPQPIRMLMTSIGSFGLGLIVAGDVKAKSWADLKGKRIAFVRGAPALNVATEAFLAFGGVKWGDVKRVQVSGFAASFNALINGQADAAFASTVSPTVKRLAASPRGVKWMPLPTGDEAAWKRMHSVAPYFLKRKVTLGAGLSKAKPWQGATYPYPILVTNASMNADAVYLDRQGDDRQLRRLQGRRAGRQGLDRQEPELPLGDAVPRGRRPRLQGKRRVERRRAGAQRQAWSSARAFWRPRGKPSSPPTRQATVSALPG